MRLPQALGFTGAPEHPQGGQGGGGALARVQEGQRRRGTGLEKGDGWKPITR